MNNSKWDNPKYQRMVSAKAVGDQLEVAFEDGTVVRIKADRLLPPGVQEAQWNALRFDAYEIQIPIPRGEAEIPWSTIRLLTDNDFAAHWTQSAEEQAKNIGQRLREIRRSRHLTSKEVAERAGITPQSLSRIERGHHDVVFTTLRKILAAMGCTLKDLTEMQETSSSLELLLKRLETAGLKREWVLDRLLPERFRDQFGATKDNSKELLSEAARYISRIFLWSPDTLLGVESLTLGIVATQAARFKVQGRTKEIQTSAYAVYAHFLALLILEATKHIQISQLPKSPEDVRKSVASKYGPLTFESMLQYVWDLGIPVIPLHDSGAFHGACWNVSGRNVIVLKQMTNYQGRWLFDLAHELGHVVLHLPNQNAGLIEGEEISPFHDSDEECEASEFASDLLFFGRAEELVEKTVQIAHKKVESLKSAVLQIAAAEHVPVDILANYLAFRLFTDSVNWWGTANNLQITEPPPREIARRLLSEHIDLKQLDPEDRDFVMRATSD